MEVFKKNKLNRPEMFTILFSLCIYGIIYFKTVGIKEVNISIYLGFLVTSIMIFLMIKTKKNISYSINYIRKNKLLILILIYFIYSVLNYGQSGSEYLILGIVKYLPILLTIFFPMYIAYYKIDMDKVLKIIFLIMGLVGIISIIMYLLGYSYFILSLSEGVSVEKTTNYLQIYGEGRLTSQFNHKSAFALYCSIGLILGIIVKNVNKKARLLINTVFMICIILSNSIAFLPGAAIIYGYYIIKEFLSETIIEINKKYGKSLLIGILISIMVVGGGMLFLKASKSREITSLNGRVYIWKAGSNELIKNTRGILNMPSNEWINAIGYQPVNNPHNVFLAEGIENGIIGMLFLISIYTLFMVEFLKNKKFKIIGYTMILLLAGLNFDTMLKGEMTYIFWTSLGILYMLKESDLKCKIKS